MFVHGIVLRQPCRKDLLQCVSCASHVCVCVFVFYTAYVSICVVRLHSSAADMDEHVGVCTCPTILLLLCHICDRASTSWVCVQCVHPFLVCNECYIVRMIGPCNRQWHRLKMSVDVEYIPSCCIEKMHLHADLPVETEVHKPTLRRKNSK